jgi:two-component system sensor histidine kinase KdpD
MARGLLRIYLGAAPGVGKTYAMLNEGCRRAHRGTDVVVGFVEPHGRPNTAAQVRDLKVVPRRTLAHRDQQFQEMDVDAILARHPEVALVDELAHSNVPGSRNAKRWQDVQELLAAGITVITTVNIQHLDSLNDVVERITGVTQRETIPDVVVRAADQIELVDMSPEALRRRMAHGNIYPSEKVDTALANYFRPGNLAALRELALLWVADRVDEGLHDYRERHGIAQPWETRERVVVALHGTPSDAQLIRRGARMAARARAELVGVHVRATDGLAHAEPTALDHDRALLAEFDGRFLEVTGSDIPKALVEVARAENATQLLLGASHRSRWIELLHGSVINRVIRASGEIDVHVISLRQSPTRPDGGVVAGELPRPRLSRVGRLAVLSRRRRLAGWLLAVAGAPLLTLLVLQGPVRAQNTLPISLLLFLLLVVTTAVTGGLLPAVAAALASFALVDWYFIPPAHTFTINQGVDALALLVFLVVAAVVSAVIDRSARRLAQTVRAQAETETLARLVGGAALHARDPLPELVDQLRSTFALDAAAVLAPAGDGWQVVQASGAPVPARPEDAALQLELDQGWALVLAGWPLDAADRRLLAAFAAQLRLAQQTTRLHAEAASAETLAKANELRTALLAAVSHDLRTPLAAIKASATSLLSDDVDWTPDAIREFSKTIDAEADRLNTLVGNLLDMSRLQTGALQLSMRPVGLEEVVFAALTSLSRETATIEVDVPETLPRVQADPALLERAVANVIGNALAWTTEDRWVRVEAGEAAGRVDLRVIDRGPGIPAAQRESVFQPFQRLGDGGGANHDGVGLGLAVARGFVEAMDSEVSLDDTPGGGLTVVLHLRAAQASTKAGQR